MQKFSYNSEKAIIATQYILSSFPKNNIDFHKLFKILYFADQKHLSNYGRPIIGDTYIAMEYGPVPSTTYNLLKNLRNQSTHVNTITSEDHDDFKGKFKLIKNFILELLHTEIDLDVLSESEKDCISQSFEENKNLSYKELSAKSHGSAWTSANINDSMDVLEIAKEAGVNEEMLKYIEVNLENENLIF